MAKKTQKGRRASAKKGWVTRRRNQKKEFLRRSRAAKKGWRRKKAKEQIKKAAKALPKKKKGKLGEWIVTWAYHPAKGKIRTVDFFVIAITREDALLFVVKAVAQGHDSAGADLTWLNQIPWDETYAMSVEEANEEPMGQKEIRKLGLGWVEIR